MDRWMLVFALAWTAGCGREAPAPTSAPVTARSDAAPDMVAANAVDAATGPTTADADPGPRCTKVTDCVLSSIRHDRDCCGDACEASRAYHRKALEAHQAAIAASCQAGTYTCPKADCPMPRRLAPACRDGACEVDVIAPDSHGSECKSDDECELSCHRAGDCCTEHCAGCERAWHRDDLAADRAWRDQQCPGVGCPKILCRESTSKPKVARCERGRCVAVDR
jgi:hypothetical protein